MPEEKSSNGAAIGIIVIVILLIIGGIYMYRHSQQKSADEGQPATTSTNTVDNKAATRAEVNNIGSDLNTTDYGNLDQGL